MRAIPHAWKLEDTFVKLVFSLQYIGLRDGTRVIRLDGISVTQWMNSFVVFSVVLNMSFDIFFSSLR